MRREVGDRPKEAIIPDDIQEGQEEQPTSAEFRALAENLPALSWIARSDGWIFWYNKQWYEYTGTDPAQMRGWGWQSVHDPAQLPAVLKRWRESIASGNAFDMTFPLRGKDGTYRPFLTRVVPYRDESGRVVRWFGMNSDISKLHATKEALRASEARYRLAMTLGRMATWETDFVKRTRKWTPEGMELFGLSLPDGIGKVGGDEDEYRLALHPADRHLVNGYHELANRQDSFPAEYRIVRPDGQIRWMSGHGLVIDRGANNEARRLVSVVTDITERRAMEEHAGFLLGELSHRSKNLLSVVQALASRTVRGAGSLKEFEKSFMDRLFALAASNDLLIDNRWNGASLGELVRRQLAPFVELPNAKVNIDGPHLAVTSDATQSIGLALHELTTNAVKYGVLSSPAGELRIDWGIERRGREPMLRLDWVESQGPRVFEPKKKGFGQVVIKQMIEQALSAKVRIDYAPTGLTWTLTAPLSVILDDSRESLTKM